MASTPMLENGSSQEQSGEVRSIKVPSPPIESELTRSEESAIDPPVYDGDDEMSIDREGSMLVQVGSMEISEKMEDAPYITPGPASHTRSHDGQVTRFSAPQVSIQKLMEEMDIDRRDSEQQEEKKMEIEDSDFEVLEEEDSTLEYTHISSAKHLNDTTIEFRKNIGKLNETLGDIKKVEIAEETSEKINIFDDLVDTLSAKMEDYNYIPSIYKRELEETKEMKKIRFAGDREQSNKASAEAAEILSRIDELDLSKLPKIYLEKTIRTLILICRQEMGLQQTINDTFIVSRVDRNADSLADVFDHLEAMRKCNTYFFLENEEYKGEIEKYKEIEGKLNLEIQSLTRQRDEAIENRVTDKSRAAIRAKELKAEAEEI